jgi:hypothetical protein
MNEPALVPNVESGPNAGNIYAMGMLDRAVIRVAIKLHRIENVVPVIEEMNAIQAHRAHARLNYDLSRRHFGPH